jgi:flagellar protein FlbD
MLTRLNGAEFALNPDLIERAECTPDTVVTLVDGKKYVVTQSVAELVARVRDYRSSVLAQAQALELDLSRMPPPPPNDAELGHPSDGGHSTVVPLHRREP